MTEQNRVRKPLFSNPNSKEGINARFSVEHPMKILVVDDNKINQFFIIELLKKFGYTVHTAFSGKEALKLQSENRYDFICMDISMPEMDGIEATRVIREKTRRENQPYIAMMTANTHLHDRNLCIAAGADEYIAKPIKVEEVRDSLIKGFHRLTTNHP